MTVWDSRADAAAAAALQAEVPRRALPSGALRPTLRWRGVQLVLKSPGLAPHDPRIAAAAAGGARRRHRRCSGELDLFVQALADLKAERDYAPQLLAITGTNGKTTTTAMTALLVERAGRSVVAAGNIGPTLLDTLARASRRGRTCPRSGCSSCRASSSKAGHGVQRLRARRRGGAQRHAGPPRLARLDGGLRRRQGARLRQRTALMVVNRDDPLVEAMVPAPAPRQGRGKGRPSRSRPRSVLRFGLDAPQRPGDFGLVVENGMAWLVRALPADETVEAAPQRRRRARGDPPAAPDAGRRAARARPPQRRQRAGRAGAGQRHRLPAGADAARPARVRAASRTACSRSPRVGEVEAYDDSKGTNVGATVAALDGLGADKAPARLVVILGGDGKGQDFAPLAAPLARHARAVATDRPRRGGHRGACIGGVPLQRHATLEAAVAWCFEQARPGDAVLLSPACASLDMFRNYGHRAEVFVQAVQALAARAGAGMNARFEPLQRWRALSAWSRQQRARRGGDALPVRDRVDVGGSRPVRLSAFDQALVAVVGVLVLLGVVMVYSAVGRAARQPEVRPLHADLLPAAPRAGAGHRLRRRAGGGAGADVGVGEARAVDLRRRR